MDIKNDVAGEKQIQKQTANMANFLLQLRRCRHMVKPVSFKGFQKGFQGVSDFPRELCVCNKYLSLGDAKLPDSIQTHEGVTGQKAA